MTFKVGDKVRVLEGAYYSPNVKLVEGQIYTVIEVNATGNINVDNGDGGFGAWHAYRFEKVQDRVFKVGDKVRLVKSAGDAGPGDEGVITTAARTYDWWVDFGPTRGGDTPVFEREIELVVEANEPEKSLGYVVGPMIGGVAYNATHPDIESVRKAVERLLGSLDYGADIDSIVIKREGK